MSHAYPLGKTARDALKGTMEAARTRYEAEDLAGDVAIDALETEWITPSEKDLPKIMEQAADNPGHGFVQHYEDGSGKTVLAVTYWKLAKVKKKKPAPKPKPAPAPHADQEDHTDDLYFKSGRTKKSSRKRFIDPNQMDLFGEKKAD
ncbi:MAG: hypothetical protein K0U61_12065 [Alphaproteobacteria bacterium]|jgi:hypothetical protein|nr:hypothetical protein [Henriciella sp.]MBO6695482.1 hypothetical protein [Henriciella sp.]MCH9752940.1 hypothetical protein [Alphaproteobacteria bacterium]